MATNRARLPREEFRARGYKTIATPFFLVKVKKNSTTHARIGVVVGKAVAKTATRRNFWKRQTRETIARKLKDRVDVLIILSPRADGLTRKMFREALEKAAEKISKII